LTAQVLEQEKPFALNVHSLRLSDEQFFRLCQDNEDLRLELSAYGELIVTPGAGGNTGLRNANITCQVTSWARSDGTGLSFDSSTMFCLPNGAKRSPDTAWVRRVRWNALTEEEREGFVPLCPDFVFELRSATDSLMFLQDKMQEYISNGAHLGLLIDPQYRKVYVYPPNKTVECFDDPQFVKGDPVLPGFVLDLKDIW
jgi:Uma2 family endonuclease